MKNINTLLYVLNIANYIGQCRGTGSCQKECQLKSIPVQEHFNPRLFQGVWYGISVNRGYTDIPLISSIFTPRNVQLLYTLNIMGDINVTISGSMVGPFCDYATGYAILDDKTRSQIMELQFNTWFTPAARPHVYLILRTDYTFAVVYSCLETKDDGCCEENNAFIWTFNRKKRGHSLIQQADIDEAVKNACIKSSYFKTVKHDGLCPVDIDNIPGGPGMIFWILTFVLGFVILVFCFTCCLCKIDNELNTKKHL